MPLTINSKNSTRRNSLTGASGGGGAGNDDVAVAESPRIHASAEEMAVLKEWPTDKDEYEFMVLIGEGNFARFVNLVSSAFLFVCCSFLPAFFFFFFFFFFLFAFRHVRVYTCFFFGSTFRLYLT